MTPVTDDSVLTPRVWETCGITLTVTVPMLWPCVVLSSLVPRFGQKNETSARFLCTVVTLVLEGGCIPVIMLIVVTSVVLAGRIAMLVCLHVVLEKLVWVFVFDLMRILRFSPRRRLVEDGAMVICVLFLAALPNVLTCIGWFFRTVIPAIVERTVLCNNAL